MSNFYKALEIDGKLSKGQKKRNKAQAQKAKRIFLKFQEKFSQKAESGEPLEDLLRAELQDANISDGKIEEVMLSFSKSLQEVQIIEGFRGFLAFRGCDENQTRSDDLRDLVITELQNKAVKQGSKNPSAKDAIEFSKDFAKYLESNDLIFGGGKFSEMNEGQKKAHLETLDKAVSLVLDGRFIGQVIANSSQLKQGDDIGDLSPQEEKLEEIVNRGLGLVDQLKYLASGILGGKTAVLGVLSSVLNSVVAQQDPDCQGRCDPDGPPVQVTPSPDSITSTSSTIAGLTNSTIAAINSTVAAITTTTSSSPTFSPNATEPFGGGPEDDSPVVPIVAAIAAAAVLAAAAYVVYKCCHSSAASAKKDTDVELDNRPRTGVEGPLENGSAELPASSIYEGSLDDVVIVDVVNPGLDDNIVNPGLDDSLLRSVPSGSPSSDSKKVVALALEGLQKGRYDTSSSRV